MKEKDIENAFREQAHLFGIEIIGQQVPFPTGIADLVGWQVMSGVKVPVIIEVKQGIAPESTAGQLLSYMSSLRGLLHEEIPALDFMARITFIGQVYGYIVAEDLKPMTRRFVDWGGAIWFIPYSLTPDLVFSKEELDLAKFDQPYTCPAVVASILEVVKEQYIRFASTPRNYSNWTE